MVQDWSAYIDSGTLGWVQALNSTEQQKSSQPPTQTQRQQPKQQAAVSAYDDAKGMGQADPFAYQRQRQSLLDAIAAETAYSNEMAGLSYSPSQEYSKLAQQYRDAQTRQQGTNLASDAAPQASFDYTTAPDNTLLARLQQERQGQSVLGEIPRDLLSVARTKIPYADEAAGIAGDVLGTAGRAGATLVGGIPGQVVPRVAGLAGIDLPNLGDIGESVGRFTGETIVPREAWELGLEALPGIGFGPDALRAARRLSPDVQDVIRRGGRNALDRAGYLYPEVDPTDFLHGTTARSLDAVNQSGGLRPGTWVTPNRGTAEQVARNQALLRGDSPMLLDVQAQPGQIERARTTFARRPAYRLTDTVAPSGQVPLEQGGLQRLLADETGAVRLGSDGTQKPNIVSDLRGTRGLTPGDPGYARTATLDDILAREAGMPPIETLPEVPNPSRYVTQPDGTRLSPNPESIRGAVERFIARPGTQSAVFDADPEKFLDNLAESVASASTRDGAPLLYGVDPSEVRNVLTSMAHRINLTVTPEGKLAASVDDGMNLTKATEAAEGGGQLSLREADEVTSGLPSSPQGQTLEQQRLNRSLQEIADDPAAARIEGSGGEPPRGPRVPEQPGLPPFKPGRNWQSELWDVFKNAWNLPRSMVASVDFSYPLRQGYLMMRHGKEWTDAFQTGFRSLFDDELARKTMADIASKERGTLHISPFEGGRLLDREEEFASHWVGKIPLLRRGQQAATVFINKLRADVYDQVTSAWLRRGLEPTQKDFEALGNYLTRATGRGTLGNFENAAAELATGLFSPRLMLARVQAPGYLLSSSSLVRKEAWKDFATVFGTTGALLTLANESGLAEVTFDPRSSDFGRLKIGNTRVDFWGGYQQMARLFAQVVTGEYVSESGDLYDAEFGDSLYRFLRSKASPGTSLFIDSIEGQNFLGEDMSLAPDAVKREFWSRLMPLAIQDMFEAIQEDGAIGGIMAATSLFGTGVVAYQSDQAKLGEKIADLGFTDPTTGEAATRWSQLTGPQKEEARKANPEIDAILTAREENAAKEGSPGATRKLELGEAWQEVQRTGDFDKYFGTVSQIGDKFKVTVAEDVFPEIKNPSAFNQKVQTFFDQQFEEVDKDKDEANEKKFRASLSAEEEKAFDEILLNSTDENYEKVKRANYQLDQSYYEPRKQHWEELQSQYPELQQYGEYGDVFEADDVVAQRIAGFEMAQFDQSLLEEDPAIGGLLILLGRKNQHEMSDADVATYNAIKQGWGIK